MRTAVITVFAFLLVVGTAIAVKAYLEYGSPWFGSGPGESYGGCPASGGPGGCCGRGRGGPGAATDIKAIESLASRYYAETYGDKEFTVEVRDYGCHQEAYIIKNGNAVKRLSISEGNVYETG
jgi:hypothetical protein